MEGVGWCSVAELVPPRLATCSFRPLGCSAALSGLAASTGLPARGLAATVLGLWPPPAHMRQPGPRACVGPSVCAWPPPPCCRVQPPRARSDSCAAAVRCRGGSAGRSRPGLPSPLPCACTAYQCTVEAKSISQAHLHSICVRFYCLTSTCPFHGSTLIRQVSNC